MMVLPVLHVVACMTLALASFDCLRSPRDPKKIWHFLLPFSLVAGVLGLMSSWPEGVTFFQSYGFGELFGRDVGGWHSTGQYRLLSLAPLVAPCLPLVGSFPILGSIPWFMAGTGLLSLLSTLVAHS